jgi:hypothetical protein
MDELEAIPLHHAARALPVTYEALRQHIERANLPSLERGERIFVPRRLIATLRDMTEDGYALAEAINTIDANANRLGARAGDSE